MDGKFFFGKDIGPTQLDALTSRKILAYSETIMMVEIQFKAGAVGAMHAHPHEQATYIVSGRFRFTNDGETREVVAGASIRFASGVEHGTVCLEDGCLVDVFTPCREDFL